MPRLVVVGGGIAGLASAWAARTEAARAGVALDTIVLERGEEVGGKARTITRDGWLVEGGPSGFLRGNRELDLLLHASGIASQIAPASDAAGRRFLYYGGSLRQIRMSPVGFIGSRILSMRGLLRLGAEPFVPRKRGNDDESVWDFAARRFGAEVADRIVAPMTLGVFAGDAHRLSLASAFPRMAAVERDRGSLILGLVARRGRRPVRPLVSLQAGMQSLPRALARRGGFTVHCGVSARAIVPTADGWTVTVDNNGNAPIVADAVILAAEPWASSELLRAHSAAGADALGAVPCPPVTIVALGFGPEARARIPDGFGAIIARGEGFRMLGNLWETSLYPGRGPAGGILVRAMFGGSLDESITALDDEDTLLLARDEISRLYGLTLPPVFEQVVRVPRAIPQYELGHGDRVRAVERALESLPGLGITGFGLRGVSFADAATDGVRTGLALGRWMVTRETAAIEDQYRNR